jgi:uncharacterized protein YciI
MPQWKRKVFILRYIFNDNDFLMKRNEIRPNHLLYLRQNSNKNGGKIEFKVSESLDRKSFYWPLTTQQDEIIQFMEEDPYYKEGLIHDWMIYSYTIIERN